VVGEADPVMDAVQRLQAWLADHPNDRFARYSLALELKKAGRLDEGLVELRELLRRHPTSGAGHYQHGLWLLEAERPEEARAAWEAGRAALEGVEEAEARRSLREIVNALADME
jgi:tetratricopeptide (TPR) repeat protein